MINEMVLNERDLIENPTSRLAVCLCLDSSSSMTGVPMDELNKGVEYFFQAIKSDEIALHTVELSIISFDSKVRIITDFSSIYNQNLTMLNANGLTSMGGGVNKALDLLEKRKNEYSSNGVAYYQPWLVLMSDGEPTDNIDSAVLRVNELSNNKKLTVFSIGIGNDANISVLKKFSSPKMVLKIESSEHFQSYFEWLSQSVMVASQSAPGDQLCLPPMPTTIKIEL